MYTEYLIIDHDTEGQEIKHVREVMPHVRGSVLSRALGIKSIRLGDAPRFVIPSNQVDTVRIA